MSKLSKEKKEKGERKRNVGSSKRQTEKGIERERERERENEAETETRQEKR
jgi:hypothetical protein